MANIVKTYTFVNGQPADATQVNKNFDDIINGVGDISAAGHALIDDANAAAQLATLGTAAYSEGTWTPVLSSFTIVGAAPAVAGNWKRIGNLIFIEAVIHAGVGGNTSVAATQGTATISGYPTLAGLSLVVSVVNNSDVNLGIGRLPYLPNISTQNTDIIFSATYIAA